MRQSSTGRSNRGRAGSASKPRRPTSRSSAIGPTKRLDDAQAQAAGVQWLLDEIRYEHRGGRRTQGWARSRCRPRSKTEIARLPEPGRRGPGILAWPVNGRVSSPFGYRVHPDPGGQEDAHRYRHQWIDRHPDLGLRRDGTVILAQTYGGYGRAVVIDHGGGMATLYAHQSSIAVSVGELVSRGEVIGYVGCTRQLHRPPPAFRGATQWRAGRPDAVPRLRSCDGSRRVTSKWSPSNRRARHDYEILDRSKQAWSSRVRR